MIRDEYSYDDLTVEELTDEISGLDKEIENCQASLAKMRRGLKQKEDLRETLIDILSRRKGIKGWTTRQRGFV
jgi:uncharacterized small protein (DUF1192 family)